MQGISSSFSGASVYHQAAFSPRKQFQEPALRFGRQDPPPGPDDDNDGDNNQPNAPSGRLSGLIAAAQSGSRVSKKKNALETLMAACVVASGIYAGVIHPTAVLDKMQAWLNDKPTGAEASATPGKTGSSKEPSSTGTEDPEAEQRKAESAIVSNLLTFRTNPQSVVPGDFGTPEDLRRRAQAETTKDKQHILLAMADDANTLTWLDGISGGLSEKDLNQMNKYLDEGYTLKQLSKTIKDCRPSQDGMNDTECKASE
jgi:hypothetical protein